MTVLISGVRGQKSSQSLTALRITGTYECHYAWPLPEANTITVRDLMVLSVSSPPLSVMVASRAFIGVELVHRRKRCANLKPILSI